MKHQEKQFYGIAKKFWRTVVNTESASSYDALEIQIEFHKQLFSVFQAGKYFYLVFNMFTGDVDMISDEVKDTLGYDSKDISVSFLLEIMHPDDRPLFLSFEAKVVDFFKSLPFQKIPFYKVQYDYRLKSKNGNYVRLLHQAVQIDYDEKNFYRTLCLETDITHIKPDGKPCFSIIGLNDEPSYFNIEPLVSFKKSYDIFTKREREILKGIVEGKSSKELADQFFVSLHTINAHRKNILQKANLKSPIELITKSIKEGWI